MFRQEEVIFGGWREKTIDAMRRRRFDRMVSQLSPLGAQQLHMLSARELNQRLEDCWQDIEIKPMRAQQMAAVKRRVLENVQADADCLSDEEHDLVERALILGGSARIEDAAELEAAKALSLRLWGNVGIVSKQPLFELENDVMRPAARAMARAEHERIRGRFKTFSEKLSALLYRYGALDDRMPQQMVLRDVLDGAVKPERGMTLARRYLWASCDCVDYGGGVALVHPALADPHQLLRTGRRISMSVVSNDRMSMMERDILPEEVPLQSALERAIHGALRAGETEREVARDLRFLCKQGAPLPAVEDVLQSALIVLLTPWMKNVLRDLHDRTPKWLECTREDVLQ